MNKANARLWVKKLRSGEFPQAQNALCVLDQTNGEPVGYCCLGVVEVLAGVEMVKEYSGCPAIREHARFQDPDGNFSTGSLTKEGQKWLGLDPEKDGNSAPKIEGLYLRVYNKEGVEVYGEDPDQAYETPANAIELNDDAQLTFSQIADVIEYFWELKE